MIRKIKLDFMICNAHLNLDCNSQKVGFFVDQMTYIFVELKYSHFILANKP